MNENICDIVLNTKDPIIIHNPKLNWSVFQGSLEDWCQTYDTEKPKTTFDQMPILFDDIQWERYRLKTEMCTKEFLNLHKENSSNLWSALQYQRVFDIPKTIREDIDFSYFGFPNTSEDCNFWLGSKNSNTPCHYDTYGCNIVVQVFGR